MSDETRKPGLTPAMKIAIGAVGVLVVGGIVAAAVFASMGAPGHGDAGGASTSGPSATRGATPGPHPGATPAPGSEVPPPAAATNGSPPAPAPPTAASPLVSAPLPESGSRDDGVVDGYPTDIAGPMDGSSVRFTSIAVQDTVMQISLTAATTDIPDDIRAHYRAVWSGLGLTEQPTADGTTTFAGPYASLTLSFASSGTGDRYVVYGVLRTQ